ncbi:MAG: hypothetical protein AAGF11_11675 [Myxococcota bacterium]
MMKTTMRMMLIVSLGVIGCGEGESTSAGMTIGASSSGSMGSMGSSTTMTMADSSTTADSMGSGSSTSGAGTVTIVGTWVSEGEDVAQLLVDTLMVGSIDATFEDLTFEVDSADGDGAPLFTQTGNYMVEQCPGSMTKFSIILEQTSPVPATVEGIYEIDDSADPAVMQYEVIQTVPDAGAIAPTCDDDFGTGQFGADNVQIFRRQ